MQGSGNGLFSGVIHEMPEMTEKNNENPRRDPPEYKSKVLSLNSTC
jgi:hypothetical protein